MVDCRVSQPRVKPLLKCEIKRGTKIIIKCIKEMNGLIAAATLANPIIATVLTVLFYLERKKLEERSKQLQNSITACTNSVATEVQTLSQEIKANTQSFKEVKDTLKEVVNI